MTYEKTEKFLNEKGQEQLLRFYDELEETGKKRLLSEIEKIDWSFEEVLNNPEDLSGKNRRIEPIEGLRLEEIELRKGEFRKAGLRALQEGKVAAVLLAGGQGTRLGVDGPKGAYDIGITHPLYIFEQQMKNLLEVVKECGTYIPLYIMTSEKNDAETKSFWKEQNYFGYPEKEVHFLCRTWRPRWISTAKSFSKKRTSPRFLPTETAVGFLPCTVRDSVRICINVGWNG